MNSGNSMAATRQDEIAGKDKDRSIDPKTFNDLMTTTARLFAAVSDIVELVKNDTISGVLGEDEVNKFARGMATLKQLSVQTPEIRTLVEATRRREKALTELAAELGEPEDVVFSKALAFFKDAIEAERRGERVVIANKDYDIVTELSGFATEATPSR